MKLSAFLFLSAVVCFVFAFTACASPEQTAAVIAAAGASATALIDALAPMLPPETLAKLQATAANIDGTVQATATAIGTIADAFAGLQTGLDSRFADVATKMAVHVDSLNAMGQKLAAAPTQEQVYAVTTGGVALSTGASRVLSRLKHGQVRGAPA